MRVPKFLVINDTDDDCFAYVDDFESALSAAREAAHERSTETILITYKGFALRHLNATPDGRVVEEEITCPDAVDRTLLALTAATNAQPP